MKHRKATKGLLVLVLSIVIFICGGNNNAASQSPPLPGGVNLGGAYVLEDWFFSSNQVGHYVSTPCTDKNTGIASSQIFAQSTSVPAFTWTSETNMIEQFLQKGYTDLEIADLFSSHRANYLGDLDSTFAHLQQLGITKVRVPIPWAITYPGNYSYKIDPGHGRAPIVVPATSQVTLIQDPFYPQLKWATMPFEQIMEVLKVAGSHGVKVLLDIHTYPGGSSDGTYNGIWPLQPEFWNTGSDSDGPIYQKNFRTIFLNLIVWTEGLFRAPAYAPYAAGLGGLTAMNEPAHLMGIPAARCSNGSWGVTYQDVLDTLAIAVQDFRQSKLLRQNNVKLYMNVIETMFPTSMTGDQDYQVIGAWWNSITNEEDRRTWAVLDIHKYFAWDDSCNRCLQNDVKNGVIQQSAFDRMKACSDSWYLTVRKNLGLDPSDLLAASEFSAGDNYDTYQSCASGIANAKPGTPKNYEAFRDAILTYQVEDAKEAGIDSYFWTWTIPYNSNYENEWSLIDILK